MNEKSKSGVLDFEDLFIPANEINQNDNDFYEMVMEGYKSYQNGQMIPGEAVFEEIREKYGF